MQKVKGQVKHSPTTHTTHTHTTGIFTVYHDIFLRGFRAIEHGMSFTLQSTYILPPHLGKSFYDTYKGFDNIFSLPYLLGRSLKGTDLQD